MQSDRPNPTDDFLEVVTYPSGSELLSRCSSFLMENEIANNVVLGIAARLGSDTNNHLFFSVNQRQDQQVLLCGLAQNGVGVLCLICYITEEQLRKNIIQRVIDFLATSAQTPHLIAVGAPEIIVTPIREYLNTNFNLGLDHKMRLRCYVCEKVSEEALELAKRVPGSMVVANASHFEEIVKFRHDFEVEVHRPAERLSDEENRSRTRNLIEMQRVWVWIDNGKPVSVVMSTRDTPSAQGINTVFTPAEFRGKKYATALVADVTKEIIESKKKRAAFLFADLDYPASNKVYTSVGFVPVADSVNWAK